MAIIGQAPSSSETHLVAVVTQKGPATPALYAKPLLAREKLGSSAIGKGIALPHGKAGCLQSPAAAAVVLQDPGCFPSPDGIDVDIVIAFLSPDGTSEDLSTIASIVKELRKDKVARAFRSAESPEELMAALDNAPGVRQ
ncbi:PTS sugar transporter subunit IIA [Mesorhizobium xinjiangense]|uniref:PTS sugar transporter subunit IIA n=1 Tax=Mesorhizobium xinjiangense TaxID=2678685 RepID=UPI0018DD77FC|nr:PTS sugar transporter subunit IIA [Mesorhizobium xinjiangense]